MLRKCTNEYELNPNDEYDMVLLKAGYGNLENLEMLNDTDYNLLSRIVDYQSVKMATSYGNVVYIYIYMCVCIY